MRPSATPIRLTAKAPTGDHRHVRVPHPFAPFAKGWGIVCGSKRPQSAGTGNVIHPVSSPVVFKLLALSIAILALATPARAQRPIDLGFTYTQERSKFVGTSSNDYFRLRGATVDVGVGLLHSLGVAFAANGLAATDLRQSIDIHQASFLVGPRLTYNNGHITPTAWNRHVGVFTDAKVGYTFATSGLFPISGNATTNHASGLTYTGGGGMNFNVYHRVDLRIQADYVQTHLPNGGSNQQNNLRFSGGLNFHFGN